MADWKLQYKITADGSQAKTAFREIDQAIDKVGSKFQSGAVFGGIATSLTSSFTSALSQLPTIFREQVNEMTRIASERQNAFKGLESISKFLQIDSSVAQESVRSLRLVKAGIVEIGDATIGLKNLLSAGFALPEAVKLLEAFSDTAAFGKSAALDFGEAIKGATEGIRNGNSVLVDNVGLTKNLSAILKDAGFAEQDLSRVKQDLNVRQALYNGLLKEALPQMGDANKLTQGWSGATSALTTAQNNLYASLGTVIINNKELLAVTRTLTGEINTLTGQVETAESTWRRSVGSMTSTFAEFVLNTRIGIRKEIADLQELSNVIEEVAYGLAALGSDFGTGWTERGAERLKMYQEAKARRGTYSRDARIDEFQTRQNYQQQLLGGQPLNRSLFPNTPGPRLGTGAPGSGVIWLDGRDKAASPASLSPGTSKSGGGVAKAPKLDLPAFGSMRTLAITSGNAQWDAWFTQMGAKFGVDPNVLLLQAGKESSFNAGAVSPKGAQGFSQFMPATAKRFNVDTSSVKDSIRGQAQYMSQLLSMFGGNYEKALAGYNAGEGAVQKFGGIPPYRETRDYVSKIKGQYGSKVRDKTATFGTYNEEEFLPDIAKQNEEIAKGFQSAADKWIETTRQAGEDRLAIRRANAEKEREILEGQLQSEEITEKEYIERIADLRIEMLEDEQVSLRNQVSTRETQNRLAIIAIELQTERVRKENGIAELIRKQNEAYKEQLKQINELQKANQRPTGLRTRTRADSFGGDFSQGLFGPNGLDIIREEAMEIENVYRDMGAMVGDTMGQMVQGIGSMVEAWVLYGELGPNAIRKMTASVLAGLAQQAAMKAIFQLAEGFAALFFNPGEAAAHFKAAALYGVVAVGAAVAGRAIAGDSFKEGGGKGSRDSDAPAGRNVDRNPTAYSRQSDTVFQSGQRTAIEGLSRAVQGLEQKIDGVSPGDILVKGVAQQRGFIGHTVVKEARSDASIGKGLMKSGGMRTTG